MINIATIYLSPSKQENNIGYGDYGSEEMRMNQITDVICNYLDKTEIVYYRNNPNMTLREIINDSNSKNPDIHFSIHSNAGGGSGAECFIYDWGGERERFARIVYERIANITPMEDRGIKVRPNLAELNGTTAPSCLLEIAFHDRQEDAVWIMNNIELIGIELARGICEYFAVPFPEPTVNFYRVRTSWDNPKSQIGAFIILSNAKRLVDNNPGYYVFDSRGSLIYPTNYLVKVTTKGLNIRSGPGTNYDIVDVIRDQGTYTIVETRGEWGKLKSGVGWINLSYTQRV
ncbi:MAG: SH3 domain-containing protein [Clostridiales bacterium]|nr:SH3 domain-containing protein [Clostridiales bacterium]